jgi:hypothetical protein
MTLYSSPGWPLMDHNPFGVALACSANPTLQFIVDSDVILDECDRECGYW